MDKVYGIINQYYESFNNNDMQTFMTLLHNDIRHDINQGDRQIGKEAFLKFMERMNHCYQEKVENLMIMTARDMNHAAAEFIIKGTYVATDPGLPKATHQTYSLPCGAFFEIKDDKIFRVTNYYNLNDWLKQIGA